MADEQLASTLARKFRVDVLDTSAAPVSVTAVASTDTFTTAAAHNLNVGDLVVFSTTAGGLTPGQIFFVQSTPSSTTFKVSTTATGAAFDLASDITAGQTVGKIVWRQVRAVAELTPKVDSTMQDDSDYDSDGWKSSIKTALEWSLELTLNRKRGIVSKQYDPGQEILRKAGDGLGDASVVRVRWYDRLAGPESYDGFGSVEFNPDGGGMDATATAKAVIHGTGIRNTVPNPTAAAA